jgi:hypothetical protein
VNAATKSTIKYGLLTAGALVCAMLAALGAFRMSPLLAGQVKGVCLVAVAIAMVVQGAVLFPRSWPSRLIVKPHVMGAGSLILFAGAALLLALLFAGCTPARGKLAALLPESTEFTTANEQFRGACFAFTSLEALKRNCCRDDAKVKAGPKTLAAVLDLGPLDRRLCGSKPRQRVCAGRN